ncbi:MAG: aminopeptidase [Eubacteriales bacterium]|nr:aminopeptidase [Eubacteriales bacterium]
MDNRIRQFANNIIRHSCDIQPGENVFIDALGFSASPLVQALIKEIYAVGANPYYEINESSIIREMILGCDENQVHYHFSHMADKIKKMDAYIAIGALNNPYDLRDIPQVKMEVFFNAQRLVVNERQLKKYVVTRYPNLSLAQKMQMNTVDFEDFFFDVCTLDYKQLSDAMDPLVHLMKKTDKVKIIAKNTNIEFSIKDMNVIKCDGKVNLPDGEVFTAPLKDSVNGIVSFSGPTSYQGHSFTNIVLKFENGRIVDASANNTEALNRILDIDDGARYLGEFAIGTNPFIERICDDILFDEKISGSIHLTPGSAYAIANNGNLSKIHWDMVLMMDPKYGGGEIYFDNVLIQKNGCFVLEELLPLNKEAFKL